MSNTFESPLELLDLRALDLGIGPWFVVDQAQVDAFAAATGDRQWIHVDPERAAHGPFGGTIAHGYLTLALVGQVLRNLYEVRGAAMTINYGLDRVRFPAPVAVGARVRGRAVLVRAEPAGEGSPPAAVQAFLDVTIEIDGGAKPACVARVVVRYVL